MSMLHVQVNAVQVPAEQTLTFNMDMDLQHGLGHVQ